MKGVVWRAVVEEDQRTLPAAAEEGRQAKQATDGRKQWHGPCCGRHRDTQMTGGDRRGASCDPLNQVYRYH